jgi:hypothetical protein
MSSFNDAILILKPASYKAGTLYSVKPNAAAGDFTVARASTSTTGAGDATLFSSVNSSGVLFLEGSLLTIDVGVVTRIISLSDGSSSNSIVCQHTTGYNIITFYVIVGGVVQVSLAWNTGTLTDNNKIAIRWAVNDFALYVNGVEIDTGITGSIFPATTLSQVNLSSATGTHPFHGKTRQVAVYNYLTDAQMITLTT